MLSCRQVVRKDKLISRGDSDITLNSHVEFIEKCMAVGVGELLIGSLKSKGEATWPCPSCYKAQKREVPIDYMSFSFLIFALFSRVFSRLH